MADASRAASDGCPFFSWLWNQITTSQTPELQLLRTQIQLELGTGETTSNLIAENSHSLAVLVSTKHYSWAAAYFDLVSSVGDPSADHAIARCIVGDVSARRSLDQIRRRIDYCRLHHSLCRPEGLSENEPRILPLRFLNVHSTSLDAKVTLVEADPGSAEPYITLSYVWGQDQAIKTTMATLARHSQSGIEIGTLPKSIRDAIRVTRHLGVNLLWVDSLCIVQNNADELAREMANMSSYYGNSLITISASAAQSSAEGFLHPCDVVHDRQENSYELPFRFSETTRGYVRLLPRQAPRSEAIDSRAWTLQEGLTSSRLVSFGRHTISWSCLTENHGEAKLGHLRQLFRDAKAMKWGKVGLSIPSRSFYATLEIWNEIVCEYCDRHLSDPADGLAAISGIAYEVSAAFQPEKLSPHLSSDSFTPVGELDPSPPTYLAGLWRSVCFPLQLLWRPKGRCRYPPRDVYVAPSWSWAAARSPLYRYDTNAYIEWLRSWGDATSRPFMVESCNLELSNTSAPFGALRSGCLTVRGPTYTTDARSLHEGKLGDVQIPLDVGGPSSNPDFLSWFSQSVGELPLTLLEVVSVPFEAKSNPDMSPFPRGLVLSEKEDQSYQRLGVFFYSASEPIPWKTATLKLV